MCGIYGIISLAGGSRRPPETLDRMGDSIVHRGPDDSGRYADGELLLGMRRLSIIDVAGGHQPIASEDGQVVVVCNGEIYNFRELRRELEARGHRFATHSDSEVAVHAYEEFGDEFLAKLEGMYGLALWDRRRRRLLVARDAYGIKPIYYADTGSELIFASEAKAILAVPGIEARLDPSALAQYLSVGYVAAPECDLRRACASSSPAACWSSRTAGARSGSSTGCRLRSTPGAASRTGATRSARKSSARCATRWSPTCRSARSSPAASTRARSSRS